MWAAWILWFLACCTTELRSNAVSCVTATETDCCWGGARRGKTMLTRTTTHTSTARNSGSKPLPRSSFLAPYPWGAFRPEQGAGSCAGRAQVSGKGATLPHSRRLSVAVRHGTGTPGTWPTRPSEQVGQLAPEQLPAGRLEVSRKHLLHRLKRDLGEGRRVIAPGQRLADHHPDGLAKPKVFGSREGDRDHRDARLDREVRKPLVKRKHLALGRAVVALGEDCHRPAHLQASVDVPKQCRVAMALAHHGHVAPGGADEPPLKFARDQDGRVGQEVQPRLDRHQEQEGELVQPVQVVGDDDVVTRAGDVLAALDIETEADAEERDADKTDDPVRDAGARADRKEVGGG